jgi:hypothetical protein
MADWNIGSIADFVGGVFGWANINFISGTILNNIIQQEINYSNTFTGGNLTTVVSDRYQPAVIDLVKSQVMFSIELNQGGIENVSLGELSIAQGGGGTSLAKEMRENAIARLRELGRFIRVHKTIAGGI